MNSREVQRRAELSRALVENRCYFETLNAEQLRDAWIFIQAVLIMPESTMEQLRSIELGSSPYYGFSYRINGIPCRGRVLPNREGGVDVVIDVRYDTSRLRERRGWIEHCLGRLIVTHQLDTY